MDCDRATRLFFDATCIVAAAGSPLGGSSFLLSLGQRRLLVVIASRPVLIEAKRNIVAKLPGAALERYRELRRTTLGSLVPVEVSLAERQYGALVTNKDAHVVAGALRAEAAAVITLDKKPAQCINDSQFGVVALSPAEFIKTVLPNHPDYPAMRN